LPSQSEKKSEIINVRITPEQRRLIDEGNLSPTEIFNKMLNVERLEKWKDTARQNLKKYPTIAALFRDEWVLDQINALKFNSDGDFDGHGLAWLLSNKPNKKILECFEENMRLFEKGNLDAGMMAHFQGRYIYEPLLKLEDLEQNLTILKGEQKLARTIKKAKNTEQFWATLSEIELAAAFKRKGMFKEFEPLIERKTPDLLVTVGGENFYVEVFTPGLAQKLEDTMNKGVAVTLGNRARGKLNEKIDQLPKNRPAIIAINRSFSEIDSLYVANAILGSPSLLLSRDMKQKPKMIREKDGIANWRDLSNIKAIIIYKRTFDARGGLVTLFEIKRILSEGGKNMTQKQETRLATVLNSMTRPLPTLKEME